MTSIFKIPCVSCTEINANALRELAKVSENAGDTKKSEALLLAANYIESLWQEDDDN